VTGFRFGNLAYISDIRHYDEAIFDSLKDLDILIISALRFIPSPMHFSIDEAIEFIRRCGAKKGWLVHMSHEVDHEQVNTYLPENIRMAYDGLEIEFSPE
jgi:phosphoribosyl 1,2-cyclic phosphate phosphodiesterase